MVKQWEFHVNLKHLFLCVSALAVSGSANALVGSLGGGDGTFLSLSSAGLNGGSVATLSGGTVYYDDKPFADIPKGGIFGDAFIAAGPSSGSPATLTFTTGLDYLSFLWGSPDTYNQLAVTTTSGVTYFSPQSMGFPVTNGDQSFSQYVKFTAGPGELITKVSFSNTPSSDAFEAANFNVKDVPTPASWAIMAGGLAIFGVQMARRRTKLSLA